MLPFRVLPRLTTLGSASPSFWLTSTTFSGFHFLPATSAQLGVICPYMHSTSESNLAQGSQLCELPMPCKRLEASRCCGCSKHSACSALPAVLLLYRHIEGAISAP